MDNYDRFEQALNDEHDYYVCMADCYDGKSCDCHGNEKEEPWYILGLAVLLIVGVIVAFNVIDSIVWRKKRKKQLREAERSKKK